MSISVIDDSGKTAFALYPTPLTYQKKTTLGLAKWPPTELSPKCGTMTLKYC